ncbi:unnamed protein product [Cylindrotheca closterium]|uniref:Orc1-like AAA ATPase domain-containing protein n=1 Tax=Cylindrotheca closterium TaxID=2856 RepID=A0AAD2CQ78_9STRA|nr:unnamed protein product [Cylindrotheca closterium]
MKTSEIRQSKHKQQKLIVSPSGKRKRKLEFEFTGLIRREREVSMLKSRFRRMLGHPIDDGDGEQKSETCSKEVVFLSGLSGVGKSTVAQTLEQDVEALEHGIFVQGKFDQTASDKPYSGIAKAFGMICEKIDQMPDAVVKRVATKISEEFGTTVEVLMHLIPELKYIMQDYATTTFSTDTADHDIMNGLDSLRFAFRALTRALSAEFSPMVLVLDDLQWADISSLLILDCLVTDAQNRNPLMVIGCYRSDEVDENSILVNKIHALREKTNRCSFNITELKVEAFSADDISDLIKSQISAGDETIIDGLAALCEKRTMGNPHFVLEFLKMLKNEGLLVYDGDSETWTWDLAQIEEVTMSTANVVVLLQSQIQKMPKRVQRLLQYAACIGSSFSLPTLQLIWKKSNILDRGVLSEPLEQLLATAEENRFIEKCGPKHYRWVHDKVQEASLLLSNKPMAAFQLDIGSSLYYCLDEKSLEEELFNVTDIINSGNIKKRPEFARLNFRAAEKAKGIFAVQSAANYAAKGIELLQEGQVLSNHILTLQLYTIGAEMEIALGNVKKADRYAEEILKRPQYSAMDKMPFKVLSIRKELIVDFKYDQTIERCLARLKELDYRLIWSRSTTSLQALVELKRTIRRAKNTKMFKETDYSMDKMTDQKHLLWMRLIGLVNYSSYHSRKYLLYVVGICRCVQITLDHGIGPECGAIFASLGLLVVTFQGDFETAAKFAEMGLAMQKLHPAREGACVYMSYSFVLCWKRPLQALLKPHYDGYVSATRMGDSTFSCWCLSAHHVWLPYMMGKPLRLILKQFPLLQSQMEELSQPGPLLFLKILWQMMVNLTSSFSNSHKLEGHTFSRNEVDDWERIGGNMVHFGEGELLLFFEPEEAADRAIAVGNKFSKLAPSLCLVMIETFHRGVALYIMARKTKQRKYKNHASKTRKTIKKWLRAGNPNVEHFSLLLDAEHAALNGAYASAEKLYEEAILLASRMEYLHHAALFNERYADFLLNEVDDAERASHYLDEAIRLYKQWGANRKIKMLQSKLERSLAL